MDTDPRKIRSAVKSRQMKKPHKLQHAVCVVGFFRKSDVASCAEALRVAGYLISDRSDLVRCPTDAFIEARRPLAPSADEKATMKAVYDEIQRIIESFYSANMDEVAVVAIDEFHDFNHSGVWGYAHLGKTYPFDVDEPA
jgi:hypothetical protein